MPIPGLATPAIMGRRQIMTVGTPQASVEVTGSPLVISKPSGVISGDLLIAVAGGDTAGHSWGRSVSWTAALDQGALPNLFIGYRTAGGSEPSSYSFTGGYNTWGVILAYRQAAWDAIGTTATLSGGGDVVAGGITSAGGILFCAVNTSGSNESTTHSTPSGMTMMGPYGGYATTATVDNDTPGGVLRLFRQAVSAGATGTRTSTISAGPYEHAAAVFGIKAV